jgi:hypothetical protein
MRFKLDKWNKEKLEKAGIEEGTYQAELHYASLLLGKDFGGDVEVVIKNDQVEIPDEIVEEIRADDERAILEIFEIVGHPGNVTMEIN